VNVIWPLEQAAERTDPVELRRTWGRDLAFMGGIDKRALFHGHAEIDAELERVVAPMLESGGFIPILDHAVSPEISYDNWLYYLERKHAMIEGG
jgi:uroporphyrinogen decarboxylase